MEKTLSPIQSDGQVSVPFCPINVFRLCGENRRINDFEFVYAAGPLCGVTMLFMLS